MVWGKFPHNHALQTPKRCRDGNWMRIFLLFSGVPYFFMNGHAAFSGAQDVDTFVKVFDMIAQKQPVAMPGDGKL